ncbi:MAG: universal stress protein [Algoriphagus sp.]|jgi:nucleotide-binding universal stress UspA family protein|uniref:universal stress protein n=1 Tax=Algoriphagus sp. TaxID=1872435 RepID=UPI002728FF44|nr:universal stress protein [Algoriphagus sp.]MDO8966433.1 universal stress protein [Algoriphagus sp.]MDP2040589.1 universal stress protein [Algoriphagus sp.]MDP3201879.1 universal stress protein [Algoriphagus sp.]MDP3473339.1 universal stress protein [Algoriphagus sp.]
MKFFSKAMVGLDLTEMDDILIKKTAVFVKFLGINKCYFVHVAKNLEIPREILDNYPDLLAPTDESIEAIITNKLKEHNFPEDIETEVFVDEGSHPLDSFLRWAKIKDVDLIIMGRKESLPGHGVLADGVAKKAPCSVLLVQEKRPIKFPKKVLIATDFSSHNHLIYEFAEQITDKLGAELVPLHLYEVPHGYSKTGKTYEEFSEIMKENAKNDFKKFVSKHHHPELACEMLLNDGKNPGNLILEFATKIEADMILLGSRGRTTSAAILLGSTAEKLIHVNKYLPMLIFKKKGETMGFFDALFKL